MRKKIGAYIWGALFLCFNPSAGFAKSYNLYNCTDYYEQKNNHGSRMPARPLQIDVTNHIITVPSQILGYHLTLSSIDGKTYKIQLVSNKVQIPAELVGVFGVHVSQEDYLNNEHYYYGTIDIE